MSDQLKKRHVHLDPVGGIAGDMFIASMLDAIPEIQEACWKDLQDSGVLEHVQVCLQLGMSHGMAVKRFCVSLVDEKPRATGKYSDLKDLLQKSKLNDAVLTRALTLLELLATAESRVHGVAVNDVHFHEVADWDSVADIVAAASIVEHSGIDSWSCSRLPTGSGLVKTEHGMLPVPAPATLVLLEGLVTWDDGVPGERVTPTGAAIVKYLCTSDGGALHSSQCAQGVVIGSGMGAGTRELADRPNILRCFFIDTTTAIKDNLSTKHTSNSPSLVVTDFAHEIDHIMQLGFSIDDMNSEELAVALQYIRQSEGVVDVSHSMSYGKKGRMIFDVTVLCLPHYEPVISRLCFSETTTLGMRVQLLVRRVLQRSELCVDNSIGEAGVKIVERPSACVDNNQRTLKVESDDLRRLPGLYERRDYARKLADSVDVDSGLDSELKGS